jgi:hypothetical protein
MMMNSSIIVFFLQLPLTLSIFTFLFSPQQLPDPEELKIQPQLQF